MVQIERDSHAGITGRHPGAAFPAFYVHIHGAHAHDLDHLHIFMHLTDRFTAFIVRGPKIYCGNCLIECSIFVAGPFAISSR